MLDGNENLLAEDKIDYVATRALRTTIGLKKTTKNKLDRNRAPGQCYDGFLCQLVGMWEEAHNVNKNKRNCKS